MMVAMAANAPPAIDVPALYATHWLSMVRLAVLLLDDRWVAEDVVQDASVSLYRRQADLREPAAALAYVRAAVVNGCRSAVRHRVVVRRSMPFVAADDTWDGLSHVYLDLEMVQILRGIPSRMREVLVLRYWADLTEAQTAAALGISVGTVKSSSSRALDKLRDHLGGAR